MCLYQKAPLAISLLPGRRYYLRCNSLTVLPVKGLFWNFIVKLCIDDSNAATC